MLQELKKKKMLEKLRDQYILKEAMEEGEEEYEIQNNPKEKEKIKKLDNEYYKKSLKVSKDDIPQVEKDLMGENSGDQQMEIKKMLAIDELKKKKLLESMYRGI